MDYKTGKETQGAIRPFPEGWYMGALPQLAPLVYTWAFLLPGSTLFDRVELAAHLEFAIFLWTLFGIPVLVRWAVARARPYLWNRASTQGTWTTLFLFPSVFIYDVGVDGPDNRAQNHRSTATRWLRDQRAEKIVTTNPIAILLALTRATLLN